MIINLSKAYPSLYRVPVISSVDTQIFESKYFVRCMECNFCKDSCCSYGVDIDIENVGRINEYAKDLESYLGSSKTDWFYDDYKPDSEVPGGTYTRTKLVDGSCVFLNRQGRGCLVHSYCLSKGIDYHDLKPMICSLFPGTFENGLLRPSFEVLENSLICLGSGDTIYRGIREELLYYFGAEMVSELDQLESG